MQLFTQELFGGGAGSLLISGGEDVEGEGCAEKMVIVCQEDGDCIVNVHNTDYRPECTYAVCLG